MAHKMETMSQQEDGRITTHPEDKARRDESLVSFSSSLTFFIEMNLPDSKSITTGTLDKL